MKALMKVCMVISKVLEILHWVATTLVGALLVCSLAAKDWLASILSNGVSEYGTDLSTYGFKLTVATQDSNINGFELTAATQDGTINMTAITLFSIGALIILALMAMVFRNIYLIIRVSEGKTRHSKGVTPFQKDVVRMVKEIGIFFICTPVVGFIMSVIGFFMMGPDVCGITMNLEGFVIGIIILCLTQIFSYGTQLQQDVDGLV